MEDIIALLGKRRGGPRLVKIAALSTDVFSTTPPNPSIPAPNVAGDMLFLVGWNDTATTALGLPAGHASVVQAQGNGHAIRVVSKRAVTSGADTMPSISGAQRSFSLALRGAADAPVLFAAATSSASATTAAIPALNAGMSFATSAVLIGIYTRSIHSPAIPAGFTVARHYRAGSVQNFVIAVSNAPMTSFGGASVSWSMASSGSTQFAIALRAA